MHPISEYFSRRGLSVASASFSSVSLKPVEGAKTVFITALPYYFPTLPGQNLARFAALPDYHGWFGDILKEISRELQEHYPENFFLPFTDNSPVNEQKAALESGLASKGKNNLCITHQGSFVFLGEIVTDLQVCLPHTPVSLLCDGCNRCIKACPNGALTEDGFDYTKCLAYITQRKGELTPEEALALKKNKLAWGCDRCSEVCPHNRDLPVAKIAAPQNLLPRLTKEDLADLSDRQFREVYRNRAFAWKGKATMLRNLNLLEES